MLRFLFVALVVSILNPTIAKADDFNARDTCGRHSGGFISSKEAHRRLGLENTFQKFYHKDPVNFSDESLFMQNLKISSYCDAYTGSTEVKNNQ